MTTVGTEGIDRSGADVHVTVTVAATGQEFVVAENETFTFGRSPECTVVLDPADRSISRLAGTVACERGHWYIVNRSTVRPMRVIDSSGYTARTLAASSATATSRHPLADIKARMMTANLPDLADLADARARVCELAVALRLIDSQSAAALDERLARTGEVTP
jgi:hypothetical protein